MRSNKGLNCLVAASVVSASAGCAPSRPMPQISYEKTTLRADHETFRVGVEPFDTAAETSPTFFYNVNGQGFLPVYVLLNNVSADSGITFDPDLAEFKDSRGRVWDRGEITEMPFYDPGKAIAAGTMGAIAGATIVGFPMVFVTSYGIRKGAEAEAKDAEKKVYSERQVVYPNGTVTGFILFQDNEPKNFKEKVNGGTLRLPIFVNQEEGAYDRKDVSFRLGEPRNYLEGAVRER